MKPKLTAMSLLIASTFLFGTVHADTQVESEQASKMLADQDKQLERKVVKVAENVYTAVG